MKRLGYRAAIAWIAENDDTEWLNQDYGTFFSVTAAFCADMYGVFGN